jgi:lipid-A-disaccharide synthase-like uncharacterized protein
MVGNLMSGFTAWLAGHSTADVVWIVIGLIAQVLFTMRFVVQWIASERAKRSIVPPAFWYFSVIGGGLLLAYAIYRLDPVFILGQAGGFFVYIRNIHLIRTHRRVKDAEVAEA